MKNQKKKLVGVSLIEVLIVISIIGILTGTSVSLYYYFRKSNDFGLAVWQVVNSVREAEMKARAVEEDDTWGVYVARNSVTIFKGDNFASRDSNFDKTKNIAGVVSVSGQNPIIIEKFTGFPQSAGTLILNNGNSNHSIIINEKGAVNY